MLVAQLALLVGLVATGYFHARRADRARRCAVPAAASARCYRARGRARPPPTFPPGIWPLYFVATAFWYNRRFGAWFLLGLVLDVAVSAS